jgi:hypothetical protein
MANILITNGSMKSYYFGSLVGGLLALTFAVFSFAAQASDAEVIYQDSHLRPETPPSSHAIHWQKQRSFSLSFINRDATFDEKNASSKAAFSARETIIEAVFKREVSPSVAFQTTLTHVKGDSSYDSEHGGITSAIDRSVRSSLGALAGSYKIMDAVVLALQLGYQISQLEFSGTETFSSRAYRLSPALAWKSRSFEIALYQARVYRSKSNSASEQQFAETGVQLSSILDATWQWQLWLQKNPQPTCCAFVDSKRSVYGGRLFFPVGGFTLSPGYRFLSEFQANQQPGTIEDVARHNLFASVSSNWEEWKPSVNLSYDLSAKDNAPSSFGSTSTSSRSEVKARTLQFGAGLSRNW